MGATDKIKNTAENLNGTTKPVAGRATGDRDLQARGHDRKATSDVTHAGEKVTDAVRG